MTPAQGQASPRGRALLLLYLVYFVGWLLTSGLALLIVFQLRVNLLDIFVALRLNPWAMSAVDKFGTIFLGLGWLVAVLITETWLRGGVTINRLWPRLARLLGLEVLIFVLSYGLQLALVW